MYLNHRHLETIDPKITAITGIDIQKIRLGVNPQSALEVFANTLEQTTLIFGHNIIRFDWAFVLKEAERYSVKRVTDYFNALKVGDKVFDTAALYKGHLLSSTRRNDETWWDFQKRILDTKVYGLKYNVGACLESLHIEHKFQEDANRHGAGIDSRLSCSIMKELLNKPSVASMKLPAEIRNGLGMS